MIRPTTTALPRLGRARVISRVATRAILIAAVGVSMTVQLGRAAPATLTTQGAKPGAAAPAGHSPDVSTQITAHDNAFWTGSSQIVLRGFNTTVTNATLSLYQQFQSWGVNFVRLHIIWSMLEDGQPSWDGHKWNHTWDAGYETSILSAISYAQQNNIYVMLEGLPCDLGDANCPYFDYPDYLYTSGFNSHGTTYAQTQAGADQASQDFWTDTLRQQFMTDAWKEIARLAIPLTGIMGYEVMNEPKTTGYADSHTTTQMAVDFQVSLGTAIRSVDPSRVIVLMTRAGFGVGLPSASMNFSGATGLGNVAWDIHDYVGARWGNGLLNDPKSATYLETTQVALDPSTTNPSIAYTGTIVDENRWLSLMQGALSPHGIPLLVGEIGAHADDLGVYTYYGVMTTALNAKSLSWCAWYTGSLGITDANMNLQPWASIVLNAM